MPSDAKKKQQQKKKEALKARQGGKKPDGKSDDSKNGSKEPSPTPEVNGQAAVNGNSFSEEGQYSSPNVVFWYTN
jgi:ATP-binding cassette, subfamily F, member 2